MKSISEIARMVSEAREMRDIARRMMIGAKEDGMDDIANRYSEVIKKWDKILAPIEQHPTAPAQSEDAR